MLTGLFYSGKLYLIKKINDSLPEVNVKSEDLRFSLFPPGVELKNQKIPIKESSNIKFKSFEVTLPFSTLLSSPKLNFTVIRPEIRLDAKELKSDSNSPPPDLSEVMKKLNRINISKGKLKFKSGSSSVTLLDFDLSSATISDRTVHKLYSPHLKIIIPIEDQMVTIAGDLNASFFQQRQSIKINLFEWRTKDMVIKTNGRIYFDKGMHIRTQIQGKVIELLKPLIGDLAVDGLVYGNVECKSDEKGYFTISAGFKSPKFISGGQEFTKLDGTANWNSNQKRINIDANLISDGTKGNLKITSKNADTRINGKMISASVISKAIGIYESVPFGGIIKKGNVRIKPPIIKGQIFIEDAENSTPYEFPMTGKINFSFNTRKQEIDFSGDKILTEFGNLTITGKSMLKKSALDVDAKAEIARSSVMNKYSMFFIDLELGKWKFNGGTGNFNIKLKKKGASVNYDSSFNFRDLRTSEEPLRIFSGKISGANGISNGVIHLKDPSLKGTGHLTIKPEEGTKVLIKNVEGESLKIFRILDLEVPGTGKMEGEAIYHLSSNSDKFSIAGDFRSGNFIFGGYSFKNLKGKFQSDSNYIDLKDLQYTFREGQGEADIFIDYSKNRYKLSGSVKNLEASAFHQEFSGKGSAKFQGEGLFDKDPIKLDTRFDNLIFYKDRPFKASGSADIFTNFADFRVEGKGKILSNQIESPLTLKFNSLNDRYSGHLNLEIKDLDLIIPWKNNEGTFTIKGEFFANRRGEMDLQGVAEISARTMAFPNFPHTLNNAQGLILFKDTSAFTLTSLKGEMGKGKIEGNGYIKLKDEGIKDLSLNMSGKDMTLYPMHKTRFKIDADMSLKLAKDKLLLSGDIHCLSALWEREFDEGVSFYTDDDISSSESKLYEKLEFDVKIHGNNDIRMVNYYGQAEGKFNLHLTGTREFPFMTGTIESTRGTFNFQDTKFNLVKAEIIYNNKYTFDPIVRLDSEAFIKNYRIRFTIDGSLSRLKPEFKASPPLPPQDIFALLSMGELFERQSSTELSSHVGTVSSSAGGTGLISNYWNERLSKSAKKLLGIDLLIKVDPIITGSSVESSSRLTLGWPITKKVMVVYSTNLSTNKQEEVRKEIYYMQYNISPSFSLICMRNEERRFSIDLRFRKRKR